MYVVYVVWLFTLKDVNTEKKYKSKPQKCWPEKGLFFGAPKFRQLKCLYFFYKMFVL